MISILMPVFNAGAFLKECLDSICSQSYEDWELLAVNDFSLDKSWEILKEYAQLEPRITALQNSEKGIIPALRLALHRSSGDYITRMDADDIMHSHKLSILLSALKQSGRQTISVGFVEYFASNPNNTERLSVRNGYSKYQNWLNDLTDRAENWSEIYKECPIPSPCWMAHTDDLALCGSFDSDVYPEDYDLAFRFYQAGLTITPVREVLHYWRDHSDRTSRVDPNYADNRFLALKLSRFLELDYDNDKPLMVWGAGKKGKEVAQRLTELGISFHWITNNERKIGHLVYSVKLDSTCLLETIASGQIIVCVAAEGESKAIKHQLALNSRFKAYFFC